MPENENTDVYIASADSIGTIVIDGRADSGVVIIGNEEISVVVDDSDLVASETPEPLNVIVTESPVTVVLAEPELTIIGNGIPGPPGPAGTGGASEADQVIYDNATYATVKAALDFLLYVAPRINSFTNSVGTVEKGASVASVNLSWSFNKAMASVTLNASPVDPGAHSATEAGPFTTDTTWTLRASDGQNTATASTSLSFLLRRYWGVSASPSLDNAGVLSLSSEFATDYAKSVTYDASGGRYIYYAFPASFGTPSHVTVGGLTFSDFTVTTLDFTNASGHTESYNVIRLNNMQTGAAIAIAWA